MDFKAIFIELFTFKTYIIFLAASLVISIGLQIILPLPLGLAAALGIFIVFPLLLRRRAMSRMGGYGESGTGGGFFDSGSIKSW